MKYLIIMKNLFFFISLILIISLLNYLELIIFFLGYFLIHIEIGFFNIFNDYMHLKTCKILFLVLLRLILLEFHRIFFEFIL
uniref:Sdh4 n=1 Tax=Pterocladiophila hemisphaerica TaxID=2712948 RepID=A0A6M3WXU9_9FLOR|nr:Sdh4 [Pterocladiophila hemisphaerica]